MNHQHPDAEQIRGAHVVSTTPLVVTQVMALPVAKEGDTPAMLFECLAALELALASALSSLAVAVPTVSAKETFGAMARRRKSQGVQYARIAAGA